MTPRPYDLTEHDGRTVDWLTHLALCEVESRLGYPLTITQGSYSSSVTASAGTHDGGGVVDLAPWDHDNKVTQLRAVGFAAWYRPPIPGLWPAHIHAALIGNRRLAPVARRQVDSYLRHRDGLAGDGPDRDPGWVGDARFTWRTGARRIARARAAIGRARAQLAEGIRGYAGVAKARAALRLAEQTLPKVTPP